MAILPNVFVFKAHLFKEFFYIFNLNIAFFGRVLILFQFYFQVFIYKV